MNRFKSLRLTLCSVLAAAAFAAVMGCNQGAQNDTTPPTVYILKWERNPNGTQGGQTTVPAGGSFSVSGDFLSYTQANIRVYGEEGSKGIRKFTVTGSGVGRCSSDVLPNGQFFTSPGPITVNFAPYVETSPAGTTRSFMAFHLDDNILLGNSCGVHSFNGAPPNLEYFLDAPANWTITAVAENGSGVQNTGNFTINVN
ncbi:MAG: hypothetical protein ACJ71U_05470 [Terriglobales bacterium]